MLQFHATGMRMARPPKPPASTSGRHPEVASVRPQGVVERPIVEEAPGYARTDYAAELAWEARRAFSTQLARGEAAMDLAEACLQVCVGWFWGVACLLLAWGRRFWGVVARRRRHRPHAAAVAPSEWPATISGAPGNARRSAACSNA